MMLSNFPQAINVAVIGASGGIGKAFCDILARQDNIKNLYAFSRSGKTARHPSAHYFDGTLDLSDEESIARAAAQIDEPLHMVIVASGVLHGDQFGPEKALRDLDLAVMRDIFTANCFGPALVAKYFLPKIPKQERAVFAALSARVGSISDNQIGGWHAYRASKAALNMMIKNIAIETARRYPHACIIGLHPGTVDTPLSKPFQGHVRHEIFTPEKSATQMLQVINAAAPEQSGGCFAYDGTEITP